jgi:UDPglucose 6-dehydrogenase
MNVTVLGLWHLGSVTAACLAAKGHQVIGHDDDSEVVTRLGRGEPPLFEPGLEELVRAGLASGRLSFSNYLPTAVRHADVVWVTYDTPVDADDNADVGWVEHKILAALSSLPPAAVVLVSSQLPVGTVRRLELACRETHPDLDVGFACSPENLRLGKAIDVFLNPDRIVVGVRTARDQARLQELLSTITPHIEWMSVESAEMTKHAINSFLALSVTFANEVACVCEAFGADAKEVERGMKTETRIGPKAYLGPGGSFAGGTLARDIRFLTAAGLARAVRTDLIDAVKTSNDAHKGWAMRKLEEQFGTLEGVRVALWGLTYKPGTDTLRRSMAIELCSRLLERGADVVAHDPAVRALPEPLARRVSLAATPAECLAGAHALVVGTEWPVYRDVDSTAFGAMRPPALVVDANRFLSRTAQAARLRYVAVGMPAAADQRAGS